MINIGVLVENSAISNWHGREHGLSLHIKTNNYNMLFDFGQSRIFIHNAGLMGIDLADVDIAFLSHGHYDHGGGIKHFIELNDKAFIYINHLALRKFYSMKKNGQLRYIGLENFQNKERFILCGNYLRVKEEVEIFCCRKRKEYFPYSNKILFEWKDSRTVKDSFFHEQNIIVENDGISVLLAGCAHAGILNILECYKELKNSYPDYVIGGFHLCNPHEDESESEDIVEEIAKKLSNGVTEYYTGHCTGDKAYGVLKRILKNKINKLSSGMNFELKGKYE